MAMNDSQKKRLENVWEALKHDKNSNIFDCFSCNYFVLLCWLPCCR